MAFQILLQRDDGLQGENNANRTFNKKTGLLPAVVARAREGGLKFRGVIIEDRLPGFIYLL